MTELQSYAYGISLCGYWDGQKYRVQLAENKKYLIDILSQVYHKNISHIKRSNRLDQYCVYIDRPFIKKKFNRHIIRGIFDVRGNVYDNRLYIRHTEEVVGKIIRQISPNIKYRTYLCSAYSSNTKFYLGRRDDITSFLSYLYKDINYYLSEKYNKYLSMKDKSV